MWFNSFTTINHNENSIRRRHGRAFVCACSFRNTRFRLFKNVLIISKALVALHTPIRNLFPFLNLFLCVFVSSWIDTNTNTMNFFNRLSNSVGFNVWERTHYANDIQRNWKIELYFFGEEQNRAKDTRAVDESIVHSFDVDERSWLQSNYTNTFYIKWYARYTCSYLYRFRSVWE